MNPFKRHNPTPPSNPDDQGGGHHGKPAESAPVDPDATASLIDEIQAELARTRTEADQLRAERDAAQHAHKLALADFQNYQRRASMNEQTAREQGVRGVLQSIIPVIDHFQLALVQDRASASAEQVMQGVSLIRDELLRALSLHGVTVINPARGEAFDPARHQALLHQPAPGVEPGCIVMCLRQGFAVDDRLVRPAEVAVAAAPSGPAEALEPIGG